MAANPKVSIVMAYTNRPQQLELTLRMISLFSDKFVEVIIVDTDNLPQKLYPIVKKFDMDTKVIPFDNTQFSNPCVAYNVGFAQATGDIVIIQNPECLYLTNVIKYSREKLTLSNYFSFSCYRTTQKLHTKLGQLHRVPNKNLIQSIHNLVDLHHSNQWYNHRLHRPKCFHFTSAIMKHNLDLLGGFDERYAFGIGYDDDEFLFRIRQMKLCVQITPENEGLVLHQWHSGGSGSGDMNESNPLWQKNKRLFKNKTRE